MGPNLIALAVPFFFLFIGLELWVAKRRGVSVYRLGDALSDLGCGVGQQLVAFLFGTALVTSLYAWTYAHRLLTLPEGWVPWVVAFFGVEVTYYWWHRLSHEVNLLWAAHVVHHHSEDYNLAVALRQSVTTFLTTLPFYLPLGLLGVPTVVFAVTLSLSTLYQFWIHTESTTPSTPGTWTGTTAPSSRSGTTSSAPSSPRVSPACTAPPGPSTATTPSGRRWRPMPSW